MVLSGLSLTTFITLLCEFSCEGLDASFAYRFKCSIKKVKILFYYSLKNIINDTLLPAVCQEVEHSTV